MFPINVKYLAYTFLFTSLNSLDFITLDFKEFFIILLLKSKLTNSKLFSTLILVKKTISLPVLRKDFIIDESQVIESKIIGADCILLIVACLTREKFSSLLDLSKSLDLDVLVEVHDEHELTQGNWNSTG